MACSSGKWCYRTKADAKRHVRAHRRQPGFTARHVYECLECGSWHMTSSKRSRGEGGLCDRCGAPVVWARIEGVSRPLDVAEVTPQGRSAVAVFHAESGEARRCTSVSLEACVGLAEDGWTFHLLHLTSCPVRTAEREGLGVRPLLSARPELGGARGG